MTTIRTFDGYEIRDDTNYYVGSKCLDVADFSQFDASATYKSVYIPCVLENGKHYKIIVETDSTDTYYADLQNSSKVRIDGAWDGTNQMPGVNGGNSEKDFTCTASGVCYLRFIVVTNSTQSEYSVRVYEYGYGFDESSITLNKLDSYVRKKMHDANDYLSLGDICIENYKLATSPSPNFNGKVVVGTNLSVSPLIPCKEGDIVSYTLSSANALVFAVYDSNFNVIYSKSGAGNINYISETYTFDGNAAYFRLCAITDYLNNSSVPYKVKYSGSGNIKSFVDSESSRICTEKLISINPILVDASAILQNQGKYVNTSGALSNNNSMGASNFIACKEGDVVEYIFTASPNMLLFSTYDEDFNLVDGVAGTGWTPFPTTPSTHTFTSNEKYFRFCAPKGDEYLSHYYAKYGEMPSSIIDAINDTVGTESYQQLPSYYVSMVEEKEEDIRDALNAAGNNKSAFVYITDTHWANNSKNSPAICYHVMKNTPVHHLICGGDLVYHSDISIDAAITELTQHQNAFRFAWDEFFVAVGNHDDNVNSSGTDPSIELPFGTLYTLLNSQNEENFNEVFHGTSLNHYFDSPAEKTRYIFPDYGRMKRFNDSEAQFIIDAMAGTDANWHIVMCPHYVSNSPSQIDIPNYVEEFLDMLDAYNARTSGSLILSDSSTKAYDFANAVGKVEFVVAGHVHTDELGPYTTDGGIKCFMFDCDSRGTLGSNPATAGTVNEQCVTTIIANYTTRKLECIRIGRGSDAEYSF